MRKGFNSVRARAGTMCFVDCSGGVYHPRGRGRPLRDAKSVNWRRTRLREAHVRAVQTVLGVGGRRSPERGVCGDKAPAWPWVGWRRSDVETVLMSKRGPSRSWTATRSRRPPCAAKISEDPKQAWRLHGDASLPPAWLMPRGPRWAGGVDRLADCTKCASKRRARSSMYAGAAQGIPTRTAWLVFERDAGSLADRRGLREGRGVGRLRRWGGGGARRGPPRPSARARARGGGARCQARRRAAGARRSRCQPRRAAPAAGARRRSRRQRLRAGGHARACGSPGAGGGGGARGRGSAQEAPDAEPAPAPPPPKGERRARRLARTASSSGSKSAAEGELRAAFEGVAPSPRLGSEGQAQWTTDGQGLCEFVEDGDARAKP